jgi:hypothetical protein
MYFRQEIKGSPQMYFRQRYRVNHVLKRTGDIEIKHALQTGDSDNKHRLRIGNTKVNI